MMDYYRHPEWRVSWGGAFNGQSHRQEMVEAFIRRLHLDAIVETGTHRGTTTAYLASITSLPIYTVEADKRKQGFSFLMLRRFSNVRRYGGDSRQFLREFASRSCLADKPVLFYLDAHWSKDLPQAHDLPLAEEVDIIFRSWRRAVVLIDDFQVPDDDGYAYDDYGPGKALTCDYIEPAIRTFGLRTFFPSVKAELETGAKRGSVTLACDAELVRGLRTIREIREWISVDLRRIAQSVVLLIPELIHAVD
jgi:hypothetical protein